MKPVPCYKPLSRMRGDLIEPRIHWADTAHALFGLVEGHVIDPPSGDDQQLDLAEDPLSPRRHELKEEMPLRLSSLEALPVLLLAPVVYFQVQEGFIL